MNIRIGSQIINANNYEDAVINEDGENIEVTLYMVSGREIVLTGEDADALLESLPTYSLEREGSES